MLIMFQLYSDELDSSPSSTVMKQIHVQESLGWVSSRPTSETHCFSFETASRLVRPGVLDNCMIVGRNIAMRVEADEFWLSRVSSRLSESTGSPNT
ncbi:hypothetical protein Lal_00029316 [Lupinus albus]|nr:hypothetical protein Lal_00029316 [Lupinus albus]